MVFRTAFFEPEAAVLSLFFSCFHYLASSQRLRSQVIEYNATSMGVQIGYLGGNCHALDMVLVLLRDGSFHHFSLFIRP